MSIEAGSRRRLALGLVSNWLSKLGSTIIRLVQVPFFLHYWSEPVFGEWLILSTIPDYLGFSDVGFATVAGNEMTMAEARGDREASLRAFQSCWWLIVLATAVCALGMAAVLRLVPITRLLNLHDISERDGKWIVVYLGMSILLGQFEQLLQSVYRSIGRNPFGSFVKTCMTLGAFAAMLVPVALGYGPRTTALVFSGANVAGTAFLVGLVRRDVPWIRYGWHYASFGEIRRLAPSAFAYMGFPLGLAFNIQGTLQAVSYALGPVAVVVFATARTISRVALQMVQMVNSTFEPEFSIAFAQRDFVAMRALHRRACQMALIFALGIILMMMVGGPTFLSHWTGGKVPPSRTLLSLLLAGVLLNSLWSPSSTVLTATNQHRRLALVYVCATGVTALLTFYLARRYGLFGAGWSLLLAELLLNIYVLPKTLVIAHDTLLPFLRSMLDVPSWLHPRLLLCRIRANKGG